MANKKVHMRKIKEVLRLSESGINISQIREVTSLSRDTIRAYLSASKSANVKYIEIQNLSLNEISLKLFPSTNSLLFERKPQPDWNYIHKEMQKKSVTRQLLWDEFIEQNPDGIRYSQFNYHYNQWKKQNINLSMRQEHKLGEKCFVDFAGDTIPITNQYTREIKKAQIFVCTLGASNYTFACAVHTQSLSDWIDCHIKAFEYFCGVPEIVVVDNLKSGVNKTCRYEPEINKTYHDFALHYKVAVIPARVRKPQDKGKVEVSVQIVERWILASLRNRTFFSLEELNKEISILLEKLNNKPFKKLPGSRYQIFEEKERKCLKPLPSERYEYCEWKKARVNIDYHIELDGHYYSVPYKYVREEVEACFSKRVVSVYKDNKQIAYHIRNHNKGRHTTVLEHMPKSHQEYLSWTPSRIINWAATIGENTKLLVERVINSKSHPAIGFRSALGIIRLEKIYGKERVENAGKRALYFKAYSYQSMKSILKKGLDQKEVEKKKEEERKIIDIHENIRGANYYKEKQYVTESNN